MSVPLCQPALEQLQSDFLKLLPRLQLHAKIYARHLACYHQKAEFIAEVITLSWLWFTRLRAQGKDPAQFPSVLATYAARAAGSGRRLCGQEKAKDALSPRAQKRHGFAVSSLPSFSSLNGNVWDEALQDNMTTPAPEQVGFRCEFPEWRRSRTERDRRIIDTMMSGERPLTVAKRFGLSPARISQLKRELHDDWRRFRAKPSSKRRRRWQRDVPTERREAMSKWLIFATGLLARLVAAASSPVAGKSSGTSSSTFATSPTG